VSTLWSLAPEILERVEPVVRYRGEQVGPDEVKTTLRLTYRHRERSLTQEEVNAAHFALMEALAAKLSVSFS
jgi:phenylalanyl-tRNA synthetase beta chain